jgi:hypothetical protein
MSPETLIAHALTLLRDARADLGRAGARKSAAYVARAIKSTEGAARHARLAPYRAARRAAKAKP